jgi:hypothetical protein
LPTAAQNPIGNAVRDRADRRLPIRVEVAPQNTAEKAAPWTSDRATTILVAAEPA